MYRDFHVKVFALNLTAVMTHPAQDIINLQREQKKYAYRICRPAWLNIDAGTSLLLKIFTLLMKYMPTGWFG